MMVAIIMVFQNKAGNNKEKYFIDNFKKIEQYSQKIKILILSE